MVVTLGQQYNTVEKPIVILYRVFVESGGGGGGVEGRRGLAASNSSGSLLSRSSSLLYQFSSKVILGAIPYSCRVMVREYTVTRYSNKAH